MKRFGPPACSLLAALGMLAACSSSGEGMRPLLEVYTGRLGETDALLAIAYDGARSVAYSCGGAETFRTWTAWYEITISPEPDGARLRGVSGDKELTAVLARGAISGTVATNGTALDFVATPPGEIDGAALFEGTMDGCRTGLLIPPPTVGDTQGVYCAVEHTADGGETTVFAQVTPIRPWSPSASTIRVRTDGVARDLVLRPVTLPLE